MELITFAIYDSKADAHPSTFKAPNLATGCRIFQASVIDEKTHFAKHPGDYSLMETGTYDEVTAIHTDKSPHIDHGTARMWRSRYFLEQDIHEGVEKLSAERYQQPAGVTALLKEAGRVTVCGECGFMQGHDEQCSSFKKEAAS